MKFFLLCMLFSTVLYAHPHCFIDVYPTINKKSIKLKWVFDEMSSQMLCMDYDKDMNGNISHNENYKLEKEAFSLLERYSYYTYFFSKQKRLKTPKYISFQASIKNNKLIYVFTIPRPSQATSIKFYDEEMYTSFILKQEHIKKANPSKKYKFYQLNEDYFVSYELIF